jgi:acetolactate synthase I/II/III large subunit
MRNVRRSCDLQSCGLGAATIVERLKALGIDTIYFHPGGLIEPTIAELLRFAELLRKEGFRVVSMRTDADAVKAADGYFRVTGRSAAVFITGGPAPLEIVGACGAALLDHSAIVIVSGDVATGCFGLDVVQEGYSVGIDTARVLELVTKLSHRVPSGEKLGAFMDAAVGTATTHPSGPAHLVVPRNFQTGTFPVEPTRPLVTPSIGYDAGATKRAAERLKGAQRIVIIAGHECHAWLDAWHALSELATRLCAPLLATPRGKGGVNEASEWWCGVLGLGGHALASGAVAETTILIVFGELDDLGTDNFSLVPPGVRIIQVHTNAAALGRSQRVEVGILGAAPDVARALAQMVALSTETAVDRSRWVGRLRERFHLIDPRYLDDTPSPSMLPSRAVRALGAALPAATKKFSCVGTFMPWGLHLLQCTEPRTYFLPLGVGPTGWALPASIGGAMGNPTTPTCALVGDVSLEANLGELVTVAESGLDLLVTVLQNQGHAFVSVAGRCEFGASFADGPHRTATPFAAFASLLGMRARRVASTDGIAQAIADWREHPGPYLLELVVDPDEMPPIEGRLKGLFGRR